MGQVGHSGRLIHCCIHSDILFNPSFTVDAESSIVRIRIPKGDRPLLGEIRIRGAGVAGSTGLMDLMKRCWELKPEQRPSSRGEKSFFCFVFFVSFSFSAVFFKKWYIVVKGFQLFLFMHLAQVVSPFLQFFLNVINPELCVWFSYLKKGLNSKLSPTMKLNSLWIFMLIADCATETEELYKMHKNAINDAVHQVLKMLVRNKTIHKCSCCFETLKVFHIMLQLFYFVTSWLTLSLLLSRIQKKNKVERSKFREFISPRLQVCS